MSEGEMTRSDFRGVASRLLIAADGREDGALVDITAKDARAAAKFILSPAWFTAHELRLAADAMDILSITSADGLTLRKRLNDFLGGRVLIKNAGGFAAYLNTMPNGGSQ